MVEKPTQATGFQVKRVAEMPTQATCSHALRKFSDKKQGRMDSVLLQLMKAMCSSYAAVYNIIGTFWIKMGSGYRRRTVNQSMVIRKSAFASVDSQNMSSKIRPEI